MSKRNKKGTGLGSGGVFGQISTRRHGRQKQTTYIIPDRLNEAIKDEARQTKASVSGFAAVLLAHALNAYRDGEIDLEPFLIDESRSPRYFYTWDFEEIDKLH